MLVVSSNIEYNQLVRIIQELTQKVDELERRTDFNIENWRGGVTNVTIDRAYDANSTTLDEIADVLGTLINDLLEAEVLK
jgi:hypothetical protein